MVAVRNFTGDKNRCIVLALPESALATTLDEQLYRNGWTVYRAGSCAKARRLACRHTLDALVLPADCPDESGWLVCAKLVRAQPRLRVVLVGERSAHRVRFANFVGAAALVSANAGADEVLARVEGIAPQLV